MYSNEHIAVVHVFSLWSRAEVWFPFYRDLFCILVLSYTFVHIKAGYAKL